MTGSLKDAVLKIWSGWKSFLSGRAAAEEQQVEQIHSRRHTALTPEKQQQLERLCNELFKKKELITSGRLQFIGLARIKQTMGRRWDGLSKIVYDTAEEVIDGYLGHGDVFIRYKDDTYVIIFAHAALDEAHALAGVIAEEIRRRLFTLEEDELRDMEIRKAVSEIRTDMLVNLAFQDMMDIIMPPDEIELPPEEPPPLPPVPEKDDEDSPAAINTVEVGTERVRARGQKKDAVQTPLPTIAEMNCAYTPLWDTKRNALTAYLCLAGCSSGAGQGGDPFAAHARLYEGRSAADVAALDGMMLDIAAAELMRMLMEDRRVFVVCPVQYQTLHEFDGYEAYKKRLIAVSPALRQFLILYVMNLDGRLPMKNAYWFSMPLRQSCRHLFAEIPLRRDINFNFLRSSGVDVAGVRFDSSVLPESESIGMMNGFCAKAKALKIPQVFALNVPSLSIATSAVCAGFDYLGGPVVGGRRPQPEIASRFSGETLVSGLLGP